MDNIGINIEARMLPEFTILRVLVEFDGILIAECESKSKDRYLRYWCDCDQSRQVNRFFFIRLSKNAIEQIAGCHEPLSFAVPGRSLSEFVFLADFGIDSQPIRSAIVRISDIPQSYLPEPNAMLDAPVRDRGSIPVIIESSGKDTHYLPDRISQIHDVLFALKHKPHGSVTKFPWVGGFSTMHFYHEMHNSVPPKSRTKVRSFSYSSPGLVEISGDQDTSEALIDLLSSFRKKQSEIVKARRRLSRYISENNLTEERKNRNDLVLQTHEKPLRDLTNALSKLIGNGIEDLPSYMDDYFSAAKATLAIERRIRSLVDAENDGAIVLPKSIGNP